MEKIKAKVIMLPTKDCSPIWKHAGDIHQNTLQHSKDDWKDYQHLYMTTDEEIKEGDWYINLQNRPYLSRSGKTRFEGLYTNCKKIVATTQKLKVGTSLILDTLDSKTISHYLPQIPQSFIEYYCAKGGIDEVEVELEHYGWVSEKTGIWKHETHEFNFIPNDKFLVNYKLKANSDNIINILLIKDSCSRDEILELISLYEAILHKDFHVMKEEDILERIEEIKQNL